MRVLITHGHVVDVVGRRIEQQTAATVCRVLRAEHIPLVAAVAYDDSLHLYPQRELTTAERVTAIRAFCAVGDVRQVWHRAVAS